MIWIEDCNDKNIPINRNIILTNYGNLKRTEQLSFENQQSSHDFVASKGWLENFRKI